MDDYDVTDLAVIGEDANETLTMIDAMDASTPSGMENVGEVTVAVKLMLKQLDALRSLECDPMHTAWKKARKKYEKADGLLKECEKRLKSKIADADTKARLAATVAVAAAKGDPEALARIEAPALPKGISTRPIPRLRVVDPTRVPRAFLVVDEAKALAALVAGADVEGCELYYETSVGVRT